MDILNELLKIKNDKDYINNINKFIINKLNKNTDKITTLCDGSIIANKAGTGEKVIINCRIDFPHVVISDKVSENKYKISPIGGLDPRGILGMKIQTDAGAVGVCSTEKDVKSALTFDDLYFETVISGRHENNFAYIMQPFYKYDNAIIGVNISNALCIGTVIGTALKTETDKDIYFTFTAGSNANFSGLKTAVSNISPKYILSVVPKKESGENLSSVGILIKEKDFIASNYLVAKITEAAEKASIDAKRIVSCETGEAMNMLSTLSDYLIGVITLPICNKSAGNETAECKMIEKARNLLLKTIEYI